MKEHPVLMQSDMVNPVMDGRKTQTRRTNGLDKINTRPDGWEVFNGVDHGRPPFFRFVDRKEKSNDRQILDIECPYGQVGDRLWVRETWGNAYLKDAMEYTNALYQTEHTGSAFDNVVIYKEALSKLAPFFNAVSWKPSIHMFRKYSRINLEITAVRVERVQDITNSDAVQEGVTRQLASALGRSVSPSEEEFNFTQARRTFHDLWDSINAKRGYGWEVNPFVWCLSFKVIK